MTYYFISYRWTRWEEGVYSQMTWNFSEYLTTTHPVKWLVDIRNAYGTTLEHNRKFRWEYALIGWNEVPLEIYETYKDEIG